jgi:hypothetical protein
MHDVLQEDISNTEIDIDVSKVDDQEIISKMLEYQRVAIDNTRPVNAILGVAEQEIASIFNYLDTYKNVSKDYFAKIISQVDKMYFILT